MKLKRYKVLKKTPKPIMNAGRMVLLEQDKIVYLKYERQVEVLLKQEHLIEISEKEEKKEEPKVEKKPEFQQSKKNKKKNKQKHLSSEASDEVKEDESIRE